MLSKKTNKLVLNIFSFFLFFTIFHNTSIVYLSDIGYYALLTMLLLSSVLLVYIALKNFKALVVDMELIIICYLVIAVLCFVGVFNNFNFNGISTFAECILLMNFFLVITCIRFDKEYFDYRAITFVLALTIVIMFVGMIGDETKQRAYFSIYDNTSAFGLRAFFFGLFSLILFRVTSKKHFIVFALLFMILTAFSNTRSCFLNIVFILLLFALYRLISKNKITWYSAIGLLFLFIGALTILYPMLYKTEFGTVLNEKVIDLTGKAFFSGRHKTWLASLEMALEKPVLGYGTGKKIYEITEIWRNDPTHSLYLQMFLENGIFSMLAVCMIFVAIWEKFYRYRNSIVIKYCAIFTLAVMFQSIFEVTLLQGNMLVGILQWLIIGIGISTYRNKNNI